MYFFRASFKRICTTLRWKPALLLRFNDMTRRFCAFRSFPLRQPKAETTLNFASARNNLTSTRIMRSSGVKAKTPRRRPLLFNACCPHESAASPTPPTHPRSAESWEVLREGEDGLQVSSPKGLFLSLAPQGEHPINPTVFVQRQIASFECQWTRRPLLERD